MRLQLRLYGNIHFDWFEKISNEIISETLKVLGMSLLYQKFNSCKRVLSFPKCFSVEKRSMF